MCIRDSLSVVRLISVVEGLAATVGGAVKFALKRAQIGVGREVLQLPGDLRLLGLGPAAPHGVTPSCAVSYTHLDVYKRQG